MGEISQSFGKKAVGAFGDCWRSIQAKQPNVSWCGCQDDEKIPITVTAAKRNIALATGKLRGWN